MYDFLNFLKAIVIVVSAFAVYIFFALLFKKDFDAIKELSKLAWYWLNTIYKWINIIISLMTTFIVEVIIFGAIIGIIFFGWKQLL